MKKEIVKTYRKFSIKMRHLHFMDIVLAISFLFFVSVLIITTTNKGISTTQSKADFIQQDIRNVRYYVDRTPFLPYAVYPKKFKDREIPISLFLSAEKSVLEDAGRDYGLTKLYILDRVMKYYICADLLNQSRKEDELYPLDNLSFANIESQVEGMEKEIQNNFIENADFILIYGWYKSDHALEMEKSGVNVKQETEAKIKTYHDCFLSEEKEKCIDKITNDEFLNKINRYSKNAEETKAYTQSDSIDNIFNFSFENSQFNNELFASEQNSLSELKKNDKNGLYYFYYTNSVNKKYFKTIKDFYNNEVSLFSF